MVYHERTVKEVLDITATHDDGLTESEARRRLHENGPNELHKEQRAGPLRIFFRQFNDTLVYILIFAGIVSAWVGEVIDTYVIFAILLFNAIFGFIQEHKAERAIELLRKLTTLNTRVLRDGRVQEVLSSTLVKGDIVILETGDKVPADMRLIEENNLDIDESSLTGESNPVGKDTKAIARNVSLADQKNMVFSSTSVVRGTGKAVVVETGMRTEIGKIARMVQEAEVQETPLQKKLKEFGKFLGLITLGVCIIVFGVGLLQGNPLITMFLTAIALAVAAVPEGLPAIVTVCLALGVQRMVKRNALIRRLNAIETLGCINVICSDKTGTITKNEMTITTCYANDKVYNITGRGYNDLGEFLDSKEEHCDPQKVFPRMLEVARNCNNATEDSGDPTERALLFAALKGDAKKLTRTGEIPFDSDTKFMATHHDTIFYYKGAPEVILEMCTHIVVNNKKRRLLPKDRTKILTANETMATNALRVLAMAYKDGKEMYFLGLMGMIDPAKEGVKESIEECNHAGIRTVMITGDHPITATAIAHRVGMSGKAITGQELAKIDDLKDVINKFTIFARVTSAQKVHILKALQKQGDVVAMTGDGVNDAPAIKNADVGIAMSLRGTDITRDASDMVLTDDNFSSIVHAIEEGRIVYDNIKKFITYLLASNTAEIGIILMGMLMGLPLPLLPIQILWINLMTDSWPALALGVDPPERGVMDRKPRATDENVMKNIKGFIGVAGIIGTVISLGIFIWALNSDFTLDKARTLALTTLMLFEVTVVYNVKSERPFENMFNNKWLNGAVALSILLQLLVIYTPLNTLFKLVPLSLGEWGYIVILGVIGFFVMEGYKALCIKRRAKQAI